MLPVSCMLRRLDHVVVLHTLVVTVALVTCSWKWLAFDMVSPLPARGAMR
jgi:hypothetical protein